MNILPGIIEETKTQGNLTLVKVMVADIPFTSIVIETPESAPYLKSGTPVKVMFKETEVIIGKHSEVISLQNRIPARITEINSGELLTQLSLEYQSYSINSIITTNAVRQLQLEPGNEVIAMVKTNEIMLSE
jgi:molybdate transport system regulatory protein